MQGQYLPRVRPTSFSETPAVVRQRAAAPRLDPSSIRNARSGPVKIADWTSGWPQGGRALLRGSAVAVLLAGSSAAYSQAGCAVTAHADPPRQVIRCGPDLTITAERGSAYRLVDRDGDGKPEAAELTSGGLFIEASPKRRSTPFQILTPHAVAAVRGTVWAVDVGAARTSVFVRQGAVGVARAGQPISVVLKAGDGVDVEPGQAPLEVKRWSPERAGRLLARFGR
jgi:ferric-dicitrate binding protein FerR (iron transport regulator)